MDVTNVPDAEDATENPQDYGFDLVKYGVSTGLALGAAGLAYSSLGKPVADMAKSGINMAAAEVGEQADTGFDFST